MRKGINAEGVSTPKELWPLGNNQTARSSSAQDGTPRSSKI
ncbi:MAG TPA: hypothetical protein VI306_07700 [Pyrinomonadaceae bacterium]